MDGDVQISSSLINEVDEKTIIEVKELEKKNNARYACNDLISNFVKETKTYNKHALLHNIISDQENFTDRPDYLSKQQHEARVSTEDRKSMIKWLITVSAYFLNIQNF